MYKKILLSIVMAVLLVACSQTTDEEDNNGNTSDIPIEEAQHDNNKDKQEDESSEETNKDEATNSNEEPSEENNDNANTTNTADNLPELNVHYIDVGQADATLLQYGNHNILFDAGDWRGNEVVNYLKAQGVTKLDLVIGSHPDADHIGQLDDVVNSFTVEEVWLSGNESTSNTFQRGLEAVLASGAGYHEPRSGEEFEIGSMNLQVLYPTSISGKSNEESISVLFTYGNVKFLFTGDADKNAEKRMINSGISVDADILQLGHHGSNTSSDQAFIHAVSPEVAIYSAGANNSYGHPHHEVVSLIQNEGIELYGTDVHGTIIVTTNGNDYSIKTNKDGTVTPKNTASSNKSNSSSGGGSNSSKKSTENKTNPPSNSSCVNLNTASYEEVQRIKHIGPERAQDLIDNRPYSSVSDLDRIKGIGPARIKDIEAEGIACVN